MNGSCRISVIVPAYNEGSRLQRNLRKIHDHLSGKDPFEVIVVDDGSQDDTAAQAASFASNFPTARVLRLEENQGKGGAVRKGMLEARGELRLFLDADLGFPIEEMDKLLPFVEQGYDCAIGSRRLPGSIGGMRQSLHRQFLGRCFSAMSSGLLVPGIRDFTCGIKLFSKKAAQEIFSRQTVTRWGFDTEILYLARHLGFKIKEVPIGWSHQPQSKVRILRDVRQSLSDLWTIRKNIASGAYDTKPLP